ncbi:MAG: tRNA adenosine(34) deaminase TadA [Oleibacter sp.]|nr:tRNA adenosine(34) deaminase TadA [Thalassolituus sp.]
MDVTISQHTTVSSDEDAMRLALQLASSAGEAGEVPVGAVVVRNGKVLGWGANAPITSLDPTAHAEIVALRAAAKYEGNYRLPKTTLYVTVEPCTMCAGAIIHSRVERIVYGATEPKAGALCSAMQLTAAPWLNHVPVVEGGVLGDECAELMSAFFQRRRDAKKRLKTPVQPAS